MTNARITDLRHHDGGFLYDPTATDITIFLIIGAEKGAASMRNVKTGEVLVAASLAAAFANPVAVVALPPVTVGERFTWRNNVCRWIATDYCATPMTCGVAR